MINDYSKTKLIVTRKEIDFIDLFCKEYNILMGSGNNNILVVFLNEYLRSNLEDTTFKEKVKSALTDLNQYMDIALSELHIKNKYDSLDMLAIEDNQKRLRSILNDRVFGFVK